MDLILIKQVGPNAYARGHSKQVICQQYDSQYGRQIQSVGFCKDNFPLRMHNHMHRTFLLANFISKLKIYKPLRVNRQGPIVELLTQWKGQLNHENAAGELCEAYYKQ